MCKQKNIKRIISIMCFLLLLFSLMACTSPGVTNNEVKVEGDLSDTIKKANNLRTVNLIVIATPTGKTEKTNMGMLEFLLVEMQTTQKISKQEISQFKLLQTAGWEDNPRLEEGESYLLFLEVYEGKVPGSEGAYVAESGRWAYYSVIQNKVRPLYDPDGDVQSWLNTFGSDEVESIVNWVKDST